MQIKSPIRAFDSIALGVSEVTPMEIVSSYSIFSNKGIYSEPIAITKIEDKYGQVIKEFNITQKEVLSPETAYVVTNLLQTVVDKGTGGRHDGNINLDIQLLEKALPKDLVMLGLLALLQIFLLEFGMAWMITLSA